jgi:NADPH-dependent glutamate synthase beta subunit-like oxidoreductase
VKALHQVLDKPQVRLLGNVEYGKDLQLEDLQRLYDAVIFTTGAEKDRDLDVPGIDLGGSFGGADFVSWFDGHPDVSREWPLDAERVAVIGAGNVALDVARMLSKTADELLVTEIPDNVYEGLRDSRVQEVHVFARRGPAQAKFTPLELRELDHSPNVEVLVAPEDIEYDDGSVTAINSDNQTKLVVRELERYAMRTADDPVGPRPRKLWLHFFESPVEVLGTDRVEGLRTERTELLGIYAADVLVKSGTDVAIDLYERQPAPFGLIRYGVAPDHPRIKGIVKALHQVLDKPQIRLLGNLEYGKDLHLEDLQRFYDAVIFTTGAEKDRDLDVPGIDLPGSFGGADFVSWFDGHPDVARTWPLDAEKVAVIGAGNVALDVARMLSKTADELLVTEIPDNVYDGLKASRAREVHVFARRGPAQAKFTPLELRELDHSPNVEVLVAPRTSSTTTAASRHQQRQPDQARRAASSSATPCAPPTTRSGPARASSGLHFFESPSRCSAPTASRACAPSGPSCSATATSRAPASHGLGRAGGLPLRRLPQHPLPGLPWDERTTSCRTTRARAARRRARCPGSTSTAGSSAVRWA